MNDKPVSNRNYGLDILRIISCFMIIIDHTAGGFLVSIPYNKWWFLLDAYFFLSKPAVPIFFMISGSLLLKREEPVRDWLNKRVLRIILVIVIFTLPHELLVTNASCTILDYFKFLWSSSTGSYWYLYAYLGLMVTLPITRKLAKSLEKWEYMLGFSLWFVFISVIPMLGREFAFLQVNYNFSIGIFAFSSYVFFLLGHFLANVCEFDFNKGQKYTLCILAFVFYFAAVYVTKYKFVNNIDSYLSLDKYDVPTSAVPAICIFILTIHSKIDNSFIGRLLKKPAASAILTEISAATFGIYLLSDIAIDKMFGLYLLLTGISLPTVFTCIAYDLCIFIVLFAIVFLLRKIPGLKKII